jgi:hypothetical protein
MQAADGLTHLIVGRRGNSAGIEDNQSGIGGGGGRRKAFRCEAGLDSGPVGLGRAAAEVFYPESIHCLYGSWSFS